jgi:hypothetical protein
MKQWKYRPIEEANLFNPAFCGELLRRAIGAYNNSVQNKFPYPLSYLVLPIVLHRPTREAIVLQNRQLHVWLQNNQSVRVGFAERTKSLIPISNEALKFLLQIKSISVDESAGLNLLTRAKAITTAYGDEEIRDCFKKAALVGGWFARAGTASNIYTMWGIKP